MDSLSEKLRVARRKQGLSLRELAARADLSPSMLSQVENGKSIPSVRSLQSLADALSMPVGYFFPDDGTRSSASRPAGDPAGAGIAAPQERVLHYQDRPTLELNAGIVWMRLTPHEDKDAQFLELRYDVAASSGAKMSYHRGREFGLVLSGQLTVEIGFEKHVLHENDSIVFDSNLPHRLVNTGCVPVRAIWVFMNTCGEPEQDLPHGDGRMAPFDDSSPVDGEGS